MNRLMGCCGVLLLSVIGNGANAATDWMPAERKITRVDIYEDKLLVTFAPSFANTQGCAKTDQNVAIVRNTNNVNDEMVSSILAAASAKNDVGLALNGCGGGSFDYPAVYRLTVLY